MSGAVSRAYAQQLYAENRILRDEVARLRGAAKEAMDLIHEDIVKGDKAGRRLKAEAILWAALTPQAGKGGGA